MRLLLDWFPNPDHAPLYAADHGCEIVVPADPDEPLAAVADGDAELCLNYQPNVTLARARGLPVRAVGVLIDTVLDTLMTRLDGPVSSVRDLAGRRVAYAVEPFDRAMFEAMAQHAALEPGSWEFVSVGFDFTRALLDDRVDAVMGAFRNYEVIEAACLGMPVRVFELTDHGVPPFAQLVLVARDDGIVAHGTEIAHIRRAIASGIERTRTDPGSAWVAYLRANPDHDDAFHRLAFDATVPLFAVEQRQDERRWSDFAAFLVARGLADRAPAARDLLAEELVR
ncbi:MAG: ABC transporter substrate-binding protein [Chloroflexota bacterium]|nr:ABC transporter substrate-binding protein [Chloroflexota bacterium]